MKSRFQRIHPCLWFEGQAEQAVRFYTSVFDGSRVLATTHYDKDSAQASGQPEGSVLTVDFELEGQKFTALNGGPLFRFNEAISLVITCKDQAEIDRYWNALSAGGDPQAQQCGWLKDRYGLSWQVVPEILMELLTGADPEQARKAMRALLQMKKLDVTALRQAAGAR